MHTRKRLLNNKYLISYFICLRIFLNMITLKRLIGEFKRSF